MTEEAKVTKKEITYVPAVREFDNTKSLITNVGSARGVSTRYEIIFDIPETDVACVARYGIPLTDLISAGVRQLSTHVDYASVGFDEVGNLKEGGHEAMQTLADGYTVGRKSDPVKAADKKAIADVKNTASELKMTVAEMMAKMKELKELGMLDK